MQKFVLDKAEWAALLCFHLQRGDVIADVHTLAWAGCTLRGTTIEVPHERGKALFHIAGATARNKLRLTTWRAES